ncbi:hypothetical protein GH733_008596 [Mirounga leonina]|nr:hypothetical protein GH733_008596 [Mirounga leonina]
MTGTFEYHSRMECDLIETNILEPLEDLGYKGPLLEDGALSQAVSGGASSPKFTELCAWLVSELRVFYKLEENVQATIAQVKLKNSSLRCHHGKKGKMAPSSKQEAEKEREVVMNILHMEDKEVMNKEEGEVDMVATTMVARGEEEEISLKEAGWMEGVEEKVVATKMVVIEIRVSRQVAIMVVVMFCQLGLASGYTQRPLYILAEDWHDVKAPAMFNIRNIGKTLVTRTQGTKIASDGLKGRVFEVSLDDLQNDEVAFRKFKLITEDVQGKNCLTNFHGMDLTRDKMCSMVKKWQTMTEAHVDVKTTDGYLLRLFCVGFTKKRNNQIRKTSYAQLQQVRQIRKKMMEIMTREVQTNDLKEVVNKLIPDSIGKDIEKACQSIYPLHDVFVRKVKMLKKPKFELGKLMELHGEGSSSGKATGDETGKYPVLEAGYTKINF